MADNVYMDLRVEYKQNQSRMVHSEVLLGLFILNAFVCVILISPMRMISITV